MPRTPLRVLLVEDHELARRGLITTLTAAGHRIAAEAATAAVARSLAPRLDYDVALVDVYLRDGDGIELAGELRELDAVRRIVMLTCSAKPNDLLRALRAGVDGYLTKDVLPDELVDQLDAAVRGETPIAPGLMAVLVREYQRQSRVRRTRSTAVRERLTPREWQILTMLADGSTTGGIALELVISIETVRSHVKAVMRKLDVHTRGAAIARLEDLRELDELPLAS